PPRSATCADPRGRNLAHRRRTRRARHGGSSRPAQRRTDSPPTSGPAWAIRGCGAADPRAWTDAADSCRPGRRAAPRRDSPAGSETASSHRQRDTAACATTRPNQPRPARNAGPAPPTETPTQTDIGVHALGLGALQIASDPARGELAQAAELKQSRREGDRRLADPPVAQPFGMLGVGLHLQLMVGIDIQLPQAEGREVPSPYIRIGLMGGDGLVQGFVELVVIEVGTEFVITLAAGLAGRHLPVQGLVRCQLPGMAQIEAGGAHAVTVVVAVLIMIEAVVLLRRQAQAPIVLQ